MFLSSLIKRRSERFDLRYFVMTRLTHWSERTMKQYIRLIVGLLLVAVAAPPFAKAATKPVRIFILAGQSNMEGHGFIAADATRNGGRGSLEFLVKDPSTAKRFGHLVDAAGRWRTRDDVWISYLDRKGQLTVGYGAGQDVIGPELGFGWVMGTALDDPVLLIKCAVGWQEPSRGFPSAQCRQATLFARRKGRCRHRGGPGDHRQVLS